jgi:hypothetical protein
MFAAQLIFALVQLQNPDFVIKNYYTALVSILIGSIVTVINVWGAKKLALMENVFVAMHVMGFFAVLITVAVASPKNDAKEVFTAFTDNGGNYPLSKFARLHGAKELPELSLLPVAPASASTQKVPMLTSSHSRSRHHGRPSPSNVERPRLRRSSSSL